MTGPARHPPGRSGARQTAGRVAILGIAGPALDAARTCAGSQGADIAAFEDTDRLIEHLAKGLGADLLLVDVDHDVGILIGRLLAQRLFLPVIGYGISPAPERAAAAIKAGAREFLPLPPDEALIAAVFELLSKRTDEPIAEDPVSRELMSLARRFAETDASVLVSGESGTGKEVLARFLHANSARADRPFVSVNCAAIPENLLESELFGHEKGAFSGALARRIGKFEAAHGGTLLLDEVTEMDLRLQAKLLRAIQEREIDRVGGDRPVAVDIRIIATTNRDLSTLVPSGRFREDLFFRLNVLNLEIRPLRERPADIERLACHFARTFADLNGMPHRPLAANALLALRHHDWPGNVRELENCMHRAVLLASGPVIGAEAIGRLERRTTPPAPCPAEAPGIVGETAAAARQPGSDSAAMAGRTVAEVEKALILDTLRHTLGNRTHAAALLGISIRTLRNKLKAYEETGAFSGMGLTR